MRILHISDTHGKHESFCRVCPLPAADVIVHSGDFTFSGSEDEAYDFMNWFCDLPYAHKIFIAGNHDDCLYGATTIEGLPDNVYYLCNSFAMIEGLKFYGIPMFVQDSMNGLYNAFFNDIPIDTDVLITHQPPFGICDVSDFGTGPDHRGDFLLAERIACLHLKYHLFGHLHEANGVKLFGGTVFSNASVLDDRYDIFRAGRLFSYEH